MPRLPTVKPRVVIQFSNHLPIVTISFMPLTPASLWHSLKPSSVRKAGFLPIDYRLARQFASWILNPEFWIAAAGRAARRGDSVPTCFIHRDGQDGQDIRPPQNNPEYPGYPCL